jgi:solute carrier family 12 sodium/potassium/chloride transporter 2
MAYILSTRKKYANCKLRVFVLANSAGDAEEERSSMAALLKKFRIKVDDLVVIADATRSPGKAVKQEFDELVHACAQPEVKSPDPAAAVTQADLARTAEKTRFQLRLAEVVRDQSRTSALVLMTLPMPKKEAAVPSGIYLAWLDVLTKQMPPFLLIRGNQESVLTFYS